MIRRICLPCLALLVAAVALIGLAAAGQAQPNPTAAKKKAPAFTLKNYDGEEVSLADYKGRHVVLEWINPGCPYVKDQHKNGNMQKLADQFKDKDVIWLAINSTHFQNDAKNKETAEKYDLKYPLLGDWEGDTGHAYGAKTTPHMFVINTKGEIIYDGAIDDSPKLGEDPKVNYVEQALNESLDGEEVSVPKTKPYGCGVKYKKK